MTVPIDLVTGIKGRRLQCLRASTDVSQRLFTYQNLLDTITDTYFKNYQALSNLAFRFAPLCQSGSGCRIVG